MVDLKYDEWENEGGHIMPLNSERPQKSLDGKGNYSEHDSVIALITIKKVIEDLKRLEASLEKRPSFKPRISIENPHSRDIHE